MRSPASSTSPQAPSKPTSPASCESSAPETASRSPCGPTRPAASDAAKASRRRLPQPPTASQNGVYPSKGHIVLPPDDGACCHVASTGRSWLVSLLAAPPEPHSSAPEMPPPIRRQP